MKLVSLLTAFAKALVAVVVVRLVETTAKRSGIHWFYKGAEK